jgi:hypothetical protein
MDRYLIVRAVVSSILGANRMVLMTDIIASERFDLMIKQFAFALCAAPSHRTIRVVHTDHAGKMNGKLRELWTKAQLAKGISLRDVFIPGMRYTLAVSYSWVVR